ncbi:phosphate transport system regulatory protein PhoU [Alkalilimnicola ehrlichii]|uniref:Phosphate-specific transport system accessory protein PhoU n=1 Tax=Alkalilimnicola ehrlichii TaxID=351052 RepID=A0A3E0WY96_9GAMM|nr:phosphate signaling complex protein PhoU [Alkalilimnicola ehrlichii]RFA30380.1 phosphate transport system regulatory protein PhoU [Alkalilimnicola ehrlichii]RFA37952.1 phosphate transport system regulatory protein PhoU [Alkalilimnicola ehrlichii]
MDNKSFTKHISHRFNEELEEIVNRVMAMGGLVEQQLADALSALIEGDDERGEKVLGTDVEVNALEVALDEDCVHVLARRQPAASDLRLVLAVIKTITDLERIGDEAERIGRMAMHLAEIGRGSEVMTEFEHLGNHVRFMLRGALDAFARMDAEHAVLVAKSDIQADRQYEIIMRGLVERMKESPAEVPRMMDFIWAARALERIGDRACNICEYVIYFVKGKDVRHISVEQMEERVGVKSEVTE